MQLVQVTYIAVRLHSSLLFYILLASIERPITWLHRATAHLHPDFTRNANSSDKLTLEEHCLRLSHKIVR